MNIFLILTLTTIIFILITVRYFEFFKKLHLAIASLLFFLILNISLQKYFNNEINFLGIIFQFGIIVAFRIHSNLFFLESPTLLLSKVILKRNGITRNNMKKEFLKNSFIKKYLLILKKEDFILEKKNNFYIKSKGVIFFKSYYYLFKLFVK
tara:strand:- start:1242 stop:1697 length:456 start_codon:yes stop_codon:yes gene_type:complete